MKDFSYDKSIELALAENCVITLPENPDIVIQTAAEEFIGFLQAEMGVSAKTGEDGNIVLCVDTKEEISFTLEISEKIRISASNSRGAAQALYYLEDLMRWRKAPILKKETVTKKLSFTPRMISMSNNPFPYSVETLRQIAHNAITAIQIHTPWAEKEGFAQVLDNCAKYGLEVYMLSEIPSKYHPDDEEADEYYESTYGAMVKKFPQIKGVILVGECLNFPSKDPESTMDPDYRSPDNIPSLKLDPGWYPFNDYYKLVNMIKKVTRDKRADFDIVFWSYNWWHASDEKRLALMDSLPKDISYLCTFEIGIQYKMDDITKFCSDYTLAVPGPAKILEVEAKRAKELGLRFYSMVSTGGRTQDFPPIAYLPFPQKWIKRYEAIFKVQEDYTLDGLHDGWMGFSPSIITELSKMCYMDKDSDFDANLRFILQSHFGEHADTVYKVLDMWSTSSDYIHASYEEQYGPLRIGTAFPFCFLSQISPPPPYAGRYYSIMRNTSVSGFQTNYSVRYETENAHWRKMAELLKEGADILKGIENPSEEIVRLELLGRYLYHCVQTVINARCWHRLRCRFMAEPATNEEVAAILDALEALAYEEIENSRQSIELLRKDEEMGGGTIGIRIGSSAGAVEWKIKQVEYVLVKEIPKCRSELVF